MAWAIGILKSCFDFNYGIGCVICLVLFGIYYYCVWMERKITGQSITGNDIFLGGVLSVYITVLLGGTLLGRTIGEERQIQWLLFWSYREVLLTRSKALAWQMVYNVIVFIPWGMLLPKVWTKVCNIYWIMGSVALFSFSIEVLQLVFKLGLFEFDDVFHNTLGAIIGYGVWLAVRKWKKN